MIGISGPFWAWSKSYLEGRFQVSINDILSEILLVQSGVHQAVFLSLFLLIINDMTFNHLLSMPFYFYLQMMPNASRI